MDVIETAAPQETTVQEPVLDIRHTPLDELEKMVSLPEEPPVVEEEKKKELKVEEEKKLEDQKPPVEEKPAIDPKEYEDLKKKVEAQEKFLNRQATEIGTLRKTTPEQELANRKLMMEEYNRLYYEEGPFAANEYYKTEQAKIDQAKTVIAQQEYTERLQNNKTAVTQFIPDVETRIDRIADMMKEDGADDKNIEFFKKNPFAVDPVTLYNMDKRVGLKTELATVKAENEALRTEVAELKKAPGKLIDSINQSATKSLNGKATTAKPDKIDLSGINIRNVPYDKLADLDKEFTNQTQ
jgi:hypothetical protein